MKIDLNLALAERPRDRFALWWAVPGVLLGLAGLLYLGQTTLHRVHHFREVHESLLEYQAQEASLRKQEDSLRRELDLPKNREVLREVRFVNGLIDRKKISLTDLATRVSALLPNDARLTSLALAPEADQLTVRFDIAGKSVDALEAFISNLEDSPDFKDPIIAKSGIDEGSTGTPETVTCSARYTPVSDTLTSDPDAATEPPESDSKAPRPDSKKPQSGTKTAPSKPEISAGTHHPVAKVPFNHQQAGSSGEISAGMQHPPAKPDTKNPEVKTEAKK